jgi:nitrate reductase delta subunit
MLTFRVLSELIKYPAPELRAETREAERILRQEGLLSEENLNGVCGFLQHLCETAQLELEAAHLDAFDRGWSTSLYLFEHIHGESRDRGQAMVKLLMRYRVHGLHLQQNELPGVGRRGCPRYG